MDVHGSKLLRIVKSVFKNVKRVRKWSTAKQQVNVEVSGAVFQVIRIAAAVVFIGENSVKSVTSLGSYLWFERIGSEEVMFTLWASV